MNTRTNVGSDNLSDEDRVSMNEDLQAWIDAGCPTAALNCPGPETDDIIFRLWNRASYMDDNRPLQALLQEAAGEISALRYKLEPQVNNPAPVFVWPVVVPALTPYETPVALSVDWSYGPPMARPPCSTCGVPYEKHGTYPTCAGHAYTSLSMQPAIMADSAGFSFPVSWNHSYDLQGTAPVKCPNGLTPDGPVCPRCGGRRGESGVDGGSWVHY